MSIMQHFRALDAALVAAGYPATSPWWLATLERFYSTARRQLVLRVGRRGGKSSTLCRVGVVEALYGEHVIPPGDVGIVGVVSVDRKEASARLRTIRSILDVLRIRYRERDGEIELTKRPIAFRVFTGSVSGVVGGTWICAICDEVARWRDADTGANPATEVLGSLRPTMATQPHARLFLSSSPLGFLDAHAKAFELGNTAHQLVVHATTWEANSTIVEAETHLLEPNERIWKREYAAIPQGDETSVFDLADIDRAMRDPPDAYEERYEHRLVIDASRGGDAWSWCDGHWTVGATHNPLRRPDGTDYTVRHRVVAWNERRGAFDRVAEVNVGGEWLPLPPEQRARPALVVAQIGEVPDAQDTEGSVAFLVEQCRAWRGHDDGPIRDVVGDQYEAGSMKAMFRRYGVRFHEEKWTQTTKALAVDRLERWLREGSIVLPRHDKLRRQLAEYSEKVTRSGSLTYGGSGRHDDYAQVLVTLAMADVHGLIPGPHRPVNTRHEAYT